MTPSHEQMGFPRLRRASTHPTAAGTSSGQREIRATRTLQSCSTRVGLSGRRLGSNGAEVEGDVRRAAMAHLVDKEFLERANSVLLLSILWAGFAGCVIAATIYDIVLWIRG